MSSWRNIYEHHHDNEKERCLFAISILYFKSYWLHRHQHAEAISTISWYREQIDMAGHCLLDSSLLYSDYWRRLRWISGGFNSVRAVTGFDEHYNGIGRWRHWLPQAKPLISQTNICSAAALSWYASLNGFHFGTALKGMALHDIYTIKSSLLFN